MVTMGFCFQVECRVEDNMLNSSMYLGHISCVPRHGTGNATISIINPLKTQKMISQEFMVV